MKKVVKGLLVIVLVIGFAIACAENKDNNKTDAIRFKEEYESINGEFLESIGSTTREISIPEENPMIYKTADEIVDAINDKETFIVYFGFKECPWCRSMISTLIQVANDLNVESIYYVDVKDIRDTLVINKKGKVEVSKEGTESYQELLVLLDDVLENYTLKDEEGNSVETGEKRIYAPNVVAIKDGEAIKLDMGISEAQTDAYQELTNDMKNEMYQKLECLLSCILDATFTCSKDKC